MTQRLISIQPSTNCNHYCSHCSIPIARRKDPYIMTPEVFKDVCEYLSRVTAPEDSLKIRWVGGEPFQIHQDWYDQTGPILETMDRSYTEMLQTSLVLYDSTRAEFVKQRLQNRLYVSFDVHSRHINSSRDEYLKTWDLKRDQLISDQIDFRSVTTITPTVTTHGAKNTYEFLKEHQLRTVSVVRYLTPDLSRGYVSRTDFSNFLCQLFDIAVSDSTPGFFRIVTIADAIRAVLYGTPCGIWEPQNCLTSRNIAINQYGQVLNCTYSHQVIGSVGQLQLLPNNSESISNCASVAALSRIQSNRCKNCEYTSWCQPKCQSPAVKSSHLDDTECSRYSSFLRHVTKTCSTADGFKRCVDYLEQTEALLSHSIDSTEFV